MSSVSMRSFPNLGDDRGSLVVLNQQQEIPFTVKRVYYIYGTKDEVSRGFHAHKELHQLAICVSGSCRMVLDDGHSRQEILMQSPEVGVDLPPFLWHEMHNFTPDCVLLVLASALYDEDDYIRDYELFKRGIRK
jgi:dTDP-4-dehydrorhamnose 3,5-epimerase-like enzyme